jgi:2'-5' RNA ligase
MMTYRPFTDRKTGVHPYSSVQINLPAILADQIVQWGQQMIADEDIYCPLNDLIHGREDEIHITLLYGVHTESSYQAQSMLSGQNPFEVRLGCVSIFTNNKDFDVVKIEAISPSLFYFNQLLKTNIQNTPSYNTYHPHVTIAYIKKDLYQNLVGSSNFRDWRWTASSVIFSSTSGEKTPIRLNTLRPVRCS